MSPPPHGKFDPQDMTDVQEAFLVGMTDQRAANIWDAADFIADLSPETRDFLRKADKEKIAKLDEALKFMDATGIVWKFLWVSGAMIMGGVVAVSQAWDWLSRHATLK